MIRDMHQLQNAPPFSFTAIECLLATEQMLSDCVRYVPYCEAHRSVWSSPLITIILEAASQLDSIWKAVAKLDDPTAKEFTIVNHHARFSSLVGKQKVILFSGATPQLIEPFGEWPSSEESVAPAWWKAYTALKHDRFSNQTEGKLEHAIHAVAALLLAIVYSGRCDLAILSASLMDSGDYNPWADARHIREVKPPCTSKIETKLFAHPLGVLGCGPSKISTHWRSASVRFNAWWALNSVQFTG